MREQRKKDQGLTSRRVDLEVQLAGLDERRRPKNPAVPKDQVPSRLHLPRQSGCVHIYPEERRRSLCYLSDLGSWG